MAQNSKLGRGRVVDDALGGEVVAQMNFVRDDDGHGLVGCGDSVHADVGDEVAGLEDGFEALEGDVLEVEMGEYTK
jgi:hypothetical protein